MIVLWRCKMDENKEAKTKCSKCICYKCSNGYCYRSNSKCFEETRCEKIILKCMGFKEKEEY